MESTGIFKSKPEMINQYKKYYDAFTKKGTNAHKLKFNPQDTVAIKCVTEAGFMCVGSLTVLEDSRSTATVKCPLCTSVYGKTFVDKLCETCQLCTLGLDTMGLSVMLQVP